MKDGFMKVSDFTDDFIDDMYDYMNDELCIMSTSRQEFFDGVKYEDMIGYGNYEIYGVSLFDEFKKFFNRKDYDQKMAIILSQDLVVKYSQESDIDFVINPNAASIKKKPWIPDVLGVVKEKHEEFQKMRSSMKKAVKQETPPDPDYDPDYIMPVKKPGKIISAVKKTAKTVVVRKVSRNASKALGKLAMSHFENNPLVAGLLASPLGAAAAPAILAILLEFAPLPEGVKNQIAPYKDALIEELQCLALDEGTAPLEDLAAKILPSLMESIGPLLMGAPAVKQLASGKSEVFKIPENVPFEVKVKG